MIYSYRRCICVCKKFCVIFMPCWLCYLVRTCMPDVCIKGRKCNYIPIYQWDVNTCPCPRCLLLVHKSTCLNIFTSLLSYLYIFHIWMICWFYIQCTFIRVAFLAMEANLQSFNIRWLISWVKYATLGSNGNVTCPWYDMLPPPWWRHQMETFPALLAICAGNSPVTGEFPTQRPVTRSFDVFFELRLNKRLSKQSGGWWFETPS